MRKYLISSESAIIGIIIAKSNAVAKREAIRLTGMTCPIITVHCNETASSDVEILWRQPESNPKTAKNPRGGGRISGRGEVVRANLRLCLSADAADWFRSQTNKSAVISELIDSASRLDARLGFLPQQTPKNMATEEDIKRAFDILNIPKENFTERNVNQVVAILIERRGDWDSELLHTQTMLAYNRNRKLGLGCKDALQKTIDELAKDFLSREY